VPRTKLALSLTDAYRERVQEIHRLLAAQAKLGWSRIDTDDLEASYPQWKALALAACSAAQREAVRVTNGYLTGFLTAELGEFSIARQPDGDYIGVYRDGGPIPLDGPRITVLSLLKRGDSLERAMRAGLDRALRILSTALDHAADQALLEGIDQDERFEGWQRAVRGTCGACLGHATGPSGGLRFPKHPHCKCVSEPRVAGIRDRFPRPTGKELFAAMTRAEQDEAIGPEVAEKVRAGDVTLAELVGVSHQERGADYITQAPVA
jgi:hypothetical protein